MAARPVRPPREPSVWDLLVDRPGPAFAARSRIDIQGGEAWLRIANRTVQDLSAMWLRMPESQAGPHLTHWHGSRSALSKRAAALIELSATVREGERQTLEQLASAVPALWEIQHQVPAFAARTLQRALGPAAERAVRARFQALSAAVARAADQRLAQLAVFGIPTAPGLRDLQMTYQQMADSLSIALGARLPSDLAVTDAERRVVGFIDHAISVMAGRARAQATGETSVAAAAGAPADHSGALIDSLMEASSQLAAEVGQFEESDLRRWADIGARAGVLATWIFVPEASEELVRTDARVHGLRLGGHRIPPWACDAFISTWAGAADLSPGPMVSPSLHMALAGFAAAVDPVQGPASAFARAFIVGILRHHALPPPSLVARSVALASMARHLLALPMALGTEDEFGAWLDLIHAQIRAPRTDDAPPVLDARNWLTASDLEAIDRTLAAALRPTRPPSLAAPGPGPGPGKG